MVFDKICSFVFKNILNTFLPDCRFVINTAISIHRSSRVSIIPKTHFETFLVCVCKFGFPTNFKTGSIDITRTKREREK